MERNINMVRESIVSFIVGVGVGNIVALFFYIFEQLEVITVTQLAVVSCISGLIGIVSVLLFKVYDIPEKFAYLLHFCIVFILIAIMNRLNGWFIGETIAQHFVKLFIPFFVAYVCVWLVLYFLNHQKVSQINEKIRERKAQRNQL